MRKLKTYEGFINGTHLGSDQVNTDSSIVTNVDVKPDEFEDEFTDNEEEETIEYWFKHFSEKTKIDNETPKEI